MFKKGESGNKRGRPKEIGQVRELARKHAEDALRALISIFMNPNEKGSTRVAAAQIVLDRACGKPEQALQLQGNEGEDIVPTLIINIAKREQ